MLFDKSKNTKGLDIIIVGCGKVGTTIVEQLTKEGHNITVIDQNINKLQALSNLYDVMVVEGNGASFSVQIEAGIKDADLLIAVTDSDELNLLCCTVARNVANCAAIARVRTPDYNNELNRIKDRLDLAMIINPDYEAASEITRILYMPSALEVNTFAHGQAELIKYKIDKESSLNGVTIAQLGQKKDVRVLVCAIERGDEVFIPSADCTLQEGDIVSFVAPRKRVRSFFGSMGIKINRIRDTLIIGGGRTAYYLANQLLRGGINVTIVESNRDRCEELAQLLPKAVIINGDGSDEETLKEVGIETVASFVPLTGIDEENIILTLYCKQVSDAKVITKINRINFKGVVSKLDLGSIVYPRYITAEAIIAYVRAKNNTGENNIETLYHMFDNRIEAIEFLIEKESEVTGKSLAELTLKKELLIAFINRNGNIIIPKGQDSIQVGDTVMIVTKHSGFHNINDILE